MRALVGAWETGLQFETSVRESSYQNPASYLLPALVFKLELQGISWSTIFHDVKPCMFRLSVKQVFAALTRHRTCISKWDILIQRALSSFMSLLSSPLLTPPLNPTSGFFSALIYFGQFSGLANQKPYSCGS